jgi:hypothetical protein
MGAPKGNRNAAHDKPWTRALERHFAQNPDKLARLAAVTADLALEGDASARQEIANRLDGKPVQPVEMSGSLESKPAEEMTIEQLRRIAAGSSAGDIAPDRGSERLN